MVQDIIPFLPGILAAYAILFVGASSPGPAVALLLGIGADQGRGAALITTLGIATAGSILTNALMILGMGLIIEQAAWAVTAMRWIGGGYLLWLAYGSFRKAANPPRLEAVSTDRKSPLRLFLTGFAIQATNPKSIAFWLAIHAVSGVAVAPTAVIVVFFLGAFGISFFCHGAWGILFSSHTFRAAYARGRRWIEAALGTFLAFMAFRLVTER